MVADAPAPMHSGRQPSGPWAPGAKRMAACSLAMAVLLALPWSLGTMWYVATGERLGLTPPLLSLAMIAVATGFGVASHSAYKQARRALLADPALRGAWLVRHMWWLVLMFLLLFPAALGLASILVRDSLG